MNFQTKIPIGSMGLVHLPTNLPYKSTIHVGKRKVEMKMSMDPMGIYRKVATIEPENPPSKKT